MKRQNAVVRIDMDWQPSLEAVKLMTD